MTFVPESHAEWNGASALRAGLAIERAEEGTLGAALKFANGTFFSSARHVAGDPPPPADNILVARVGGAFQATPGLQRLPAQDEPGSPTLLARLDLSLFAAPASAVNTTPSSGTLSMIGAATAGDIVHLRGARHPDWIATTYLSDYDGPKHDPFFIGLPFLRSCLGVVDLTPLGSASAQQGNSGCTVWLEKPGGFQLIGHFDASSEAAPLGLVVRYHAAFSVLGFPMDCVI